MRRVLILDTSILCVWLAIPGFERCGPEHDAWNLGRVDALIKEEIKEKNTTLVLPLAVVIETGNHIAKSVKHRFERASHLMAILAKSLDGSSPWATFTDQNLLWGAEELVRLAKEWPTQASGRLSLADASISRVAGYYQRSGFSVRILTGDKGLEALQPASDAPIPRRRQR